MILTWNPPTDNGCPLTMYTIYYQQIQPPEIGEPWYQVNLTDIMATNFTISLSCDTQYTIDISAWNELGESYRSRPLIIKTIAGTFSNISSDNVSRRVEKCREDPSDQVRQTEKVGFCAVSVSRQREGEERESKYGILMWLSRETFYARVLPKGTDTMILGLHVTSSFSKTKKYQS